MAKRSTSICKRPDLAARNRSKKMRAAVSRKNTTHGMSKHPLYSIWKEVRKRCYNPKFHRYSRYGGRGIGVCKRWRDWFPYFVEDMGDRPSPQHSIDRIDNDWHYEPGNCRWATGSEQESNKGMHPRNTSGFKGVSKKGNTYRAYYNKDGKQIFKEGFATAEAAAAWRRKHV